MRGIEYTHPDVFERGVREGWADPEVDPTRIDWPARQAAAAIPFQVVNGRPLNPGAPTGIRYGRGELGHWGEKQAADAIVTARVGGHLWLLMVERDDDHGWAAPGGCLDPGEGPLSAALRELREETGLIVKGVAVRTFPTRKVDDPRETDEAWMVTTPALVDLGHLAELPAVVGADDARRAAWVRADTYATLVDYLKDVYRGSVFRAHEAMLQDRLR